MKPKPDTKELKAAAWRIIGEQYLAGHGLSPHKQSRRGGRYAPLVVARAIGIRVELAARLVDELIKEEQLFKEHTRDRAVLAPANSHLLNPGQPCARCRQLVWREAANMTKEWLEQQAVLNSIL